MKAKKLSPSILNNTVLRWADHCSKCEKFHWTKHDSNAVFLAKIYIKDSANERYTDRKESVRFVQILNKIIYKIGDELVSEIIKPIMNDNGAHYDYWEVTIRDHTKENYSKIIKKIIETYNLQTGDHLREIGGDMTIATVALYLLMHTNIYETRFNSKL